MLSRGPAGSWEEKERRGRLSMKEECSIRRCVRHRGMQKWLLQCVPPSARRMGSEQRWCAARFPAMHTGGPLGPKRFAASLHRGSPFEQRRLQATGYRLQQEGKCQGAPGNGRTGGLACNESPVQLLSTRGGRNQAPRSWGAVAFSGGKGCRTIVHCRA